MDGLRIVQYKRDDILYSMATILEWEPSLSRVSMFFLCLIFQLYNSGSWETFSSAVSGLSSDCSVIASSKTSPVSLLFCPLMGVASSSGSASMTDRVASRFELGSINFTVSLNRHHSLSPETGKESIHMRPGIKSSSYTLPGG